MNDLSKPVVESIVESECEDVFRYLGCHQITSDENETICFCCRAFFPNALSVQVVSWGEHEHLSNTEKVHPSGLFVAYFSEEPQRYQYRVEYLDQVVIEEDVYQFPSTVHEDDLYLFAEGTHERAYQFMGAHLVEVDGVFGCRFCVWAPNALRCSVIGEFNHWDGRRHVMRKHIPSGIWEIFIPGLKNGCLYKYELKSRDGSLLPHKADPYGRACQRPPARASIVSNDQFRWGDDEWMEKRKDWTGSDSAISIYEVQLGSWKRVVEDDGRFLGYRELADQLIPYVKDMGFTHIQLMPVSEFPFDGSWGYQPTGMFAPTSRFGSPVEFKYFVNQCHEADIAVLIDWVPGHFPTDDFGLGRFDGTPLYEHADSRQGYHPDWNTFIYNYGRSEVSSFLLSNAIYWFDVFHIDGLRVDAVASMLYLDYSRQDGEWLPNVYGGRENIEALELIKRVNERVYKNFPSVMMVAEESTAWPGVSRPIYNGGLGFGFKWNMGWMNDSLEYMKKEPIHRQFHHNEMTFSLYYAFSENYVLPLSHDEVVHGKGSILSRMPGDSWQQFANLRAYYAFMWTHPGKKLLFMGSEFAQGPEWDHNNSLCWHQLEFDSHKGVQTLVRDLNTLYRSSEAYHGNDNESSGFEWIEADDGHNSVFAYMRKSKDGHRSAVVVCNFTPVIRESYRIGISQPGYYVERLNTDSRRYGGENCGNSGGVHSEPVPQHYREHSLELTLPPLAALIFERED